MLSRSVFDLAGGEPTFRLLVQRFYARVATDPILRAVYPEQDLAAATERLTLFLIQYWGGPTTYSDERGHPRLRLRHAPFAIDSAARDRWLTHMRTALLEAVNEGLGADAANELWGYFVPVADGMRNRDG